MHIIGLELFLRKVLRGGLAFVKVTRGIGVVYGLWTEEIMGYFLTIEPETAVRQIPGRCRKRIWLAKCI